jgi:hypothetical protein
MPSTDANRPPRTRRRRWPALALVAALVLTVGAASATAASNIEGVWSFGGGQIAVEGLSNGTFAGTVVAETKFAECVHPVGQQIWTGMTLQPDGSYDGYHQWYFENSGCKENPERGPTAWRVLEEAGGSSYLLVCLSSPGSSQPSIAPNGSFSGVTYGCIKSALTAPLPTTGNPGSGSGSGSSSTPGSGVAGEIERLSLPSAKKCLSARVFRIHLLEPKYDPFKTVQVTIKGRKIATTRQGNYVVATINLKGLKHGKFTVVIKATTVLGHQLSGTRTYHTCAKKAKNTKPAKLR